MAITDREKIQEVIGKTEDYFEEKLTYISAGALGLTLTFIEKIIPLTDSVGTVFLVMGWGFLVMTLLLNLSSHLISKQYLFKTQIELDKSNDTKNLKDIYLKVIKRNKRTECINWITVGLLIFGISCIVTSVSINSFNKSTSIINTTNNVTQKLDSILKNSQLKNYDYDRE